MGEELLFGKQPTFRVLFEIHMLFYKTLSTCKRASMLCKIIEKQVVVRVLFIIRVSIGKAAPSVWLSHMGRLWGTVRLRAQTSAQTKQHSRSCYRQISSPL